MCSLKSRIFLLLVFIINMRFAEPRKKPFFRKDYTYLPSTDSFYKFHTISRTWAETKDRCELEGAKLFYPQNVTEAEVVISFWKETQPSFNWIFIGITDIIAEVSTGFFKTIDGQPIEDVHNQWVSGEPNGLGEQEHCVNLNNGGKLNDDYCNKKFPFICKKAFAELDWDQDCDMPHRGYIFNPKLGKCYKFHSTPKNWTDAIITCSGEQSYLAIINSQAESDHLMQMIANTTNVDNSGSFTPDVYHLGFHNRDSKGWKTIKGVPLRNSGFAIWSDGQPDNIGGEEDCGTMFRTGGFNDINCSNRCFFFCEHDLDTRASKIEEPCHI